MAIISLTNKILNLNSHNMSIPPICNICKKEEDFWVNISDRKKFNEYFENYVCVECSNKRNKQ